MGFENWLNSDFWNVSQWACHKLIFCYHNKANYVAWCSEKWISEGFSIWIKYRTCLYWFCMRSLLWSWWTWADAKLTVFHTVLPRWQLLWVALKSPLALYWCLYDYYSNRCRYLMDRCRPLRLNKRVKFHHLEMTMWTVKKDLKP